MDLPLPETWAEARGHLLPVLRGPTSPAQAWEVGLRRADARGIRQPLTPFLDIAVVLDLPELRLFLQAGHLYTWGASPAAAFTAALENLPPSTGLQPWEVDGVWTLEATDGYASSRLALPGWLAAFEGRVRGRPLAVVPDAHTILVGGTEGGLPTEALLSHAWNRFHSAGTPVSPGPITLDADGLLTPWRPPLDHPLVHRVQACHRFGAGHEYRRQQRPLADFLLGRGVPDWVADFSLMRHPSGRVVSFAHWPDGPTLLPRVDLVVLGDPGALDAGPAVPWSELVDAGVLGEPEPFLRPPRWRLTRRPALDAFAGVDPRSFQPD